MNSVVAEAPDWPVLLLTTYDQDTYVHRALRAGASGFLLKSLPPEELIAAARSDALIDPSVTRRLISRSRLADSVAPPPASASATRRSRPTSPAS